MKLFKLCSVLCVTLCIVGLGIDLHVSASTGLEEKKQESRRICSTSSGT